MNPSTFERKLRSTFEDRGLFLRRALHPLDARAIRFNRKLPKGEKRFTWQIFRKSKTGKIQMVWNICHRDGSPKGLYEEEIAHMAICDNYQYWKNDPDSPTRADLDRMDVGLFNIDEEEAERRRRADAWREYRREHCMPRMRHDFLRADRNIRAASTIQHAVTQRPRMIHRRGKVIHST